MPVQRVILTYKEYEALPADGRRYEIHDGELSVTPAPPRAERTRRPSLRGRPSTAGETLAPARLPAERNDPDAVGATSSRYRHDEVTTSSRRDIAVHPPGAVAHDLS